LALTEDRCPVKLLIVWPGYRKFNRLFFRHLADDPRFEIRIIWIRKFNPEEVPPDSLLARVKWQVIGSDNIRVSSYTIENFFKLVVALWKGCGWADVVLTSTQAPLHSKIAYIFCRLRRQKILIKTEQWVPFRATSLAMKLYKRLDTHILRHCHIVLPHGRNQMNFARSLGVPPKRLLVLPFLSEDLAAVPPLETDLKGRFDLAGKKVILYFGRITPRKGLQDLLRAFSKVTAAIHNTALLVCGGADPRFLDFSEATSYELECRTMAKELGLGNITFVGPIPPANKQDYFRLADIFVHPHTNLGGLVEGWGLVLNEAASLGLPIITTDRVGGAPDLVEAGGSGYIIPAGDWKIMADKIIELLGDEGKMERFSQRSRVIFENYHRPGDIPDILWRALEGGETEASDHYR